MFAVLDSIVVVLTDASLMINEPVKAGSTFTVNDLDALAPLPAIAPRSHVTVPVGDSVHPAGSAPLTVSPVGSISLTLTPAASDGPLFVTSSLMVVVWPALTDDGLNVLSIERSAS